ncbi:MAG: DNA mismatch repair endonuclease MutL [Proteobacteria bacterium]|nr:DNA mismatch repair endonuclease MutL [Pseudomonadota bacterium]
MNPKTPTNSDDLERLEAPLDGRIAPLPDALVDQIAAGEVVERPASVVKELVENALDAEARRVRVEVREGGRALIAVRDDGYGMSPRDAKLALRRHATSKIREADDLTRIASFGFRGEALPAIASVSRLRLVTRAAAADTAWELQVEGGELVRDRQVGGPPGTSIEVADLFGQVPARRKFLKKPTTEWGHIADWLTRSALALPGVHFEVVRDDRPAWVWPATDDGLERIAAVLSEAEAERLVSSVHDEQGVEVEAYISTPEFTRGTANGLYLFVNGRPVRDRLLRHALLEACRDVLPRGRYPTAVLFVVVPLDAVDVNVHPAKWEVRFRDPQAVHAAVRHAVRGVLSERRWLGTAQVDARVPVAPAELPRRPEPVEPAAGTTRDWVLAERRADAQMVADAPASQAPARPFRFSELTLLGQLRATYLLAEGKEGLVLVDQHAAHERVLYERLRAEWVASRVERQGLLMPLHLELDPAGVAALGEATETLAGLGFEVEAFGETAVVVRAVPALLGHHDPAALVRGLAAELRERPLRRDEGAGGVRRLPALDSLFASMACHSARRAGEALVEAEQRALLDALDAIPWAPTCPHGRPVAVLLSSGEIERRFGRDYA